MRIEQYTSKEKLPALMKGSYYHSAEFFHLLEDSSGITPIMFVAYDGDEELGHMLAILKRDLRLLPPGIYHWCSIYGEGVYSEKCTDRNTLFHHFMQRLIKALDMRYLFIEVRHITDPRTTYRTFSRFGFVPRDDTRIYISLHSRNPEERLSRAYRAHIRRATERGVTYSQATGAEEIKEGMKLLKKYYASKISRYFAPTDLLHKILLGSTQESPDARMFTVRNKEGKMIGCSICLYSEERVYLLYSCGLRKSHPLLYPGIMSVWAAIEDAHKRGIPHFEFAVSGAPLRKNTGFRNFILNFGGKQVSTIRWYRYRWMWINKILRKIYV
ncbi:MAG: GNAT family N-acetyltransferase [Bacteroidaceae bacterium]|nr:GNAT family N-acetyltransferase [Bacteroidales bacterium]MBR6805073.1 GNAT family N-acetyltransferase [Bacteroidaceae bacterium]